jgi:hypothetical protein
MVYEIGGWKLTGERETPGNSTFLPFPLPRPEVLQQGLCRFNIVLLSAMQDFPQSYFCYAI